MDLNLLDVLYNKRFFGNNDNLCIDCGNFTHISCLLVDRGKRLKKQRHY